MKAETAETKKMNEKQNNQIGQLNEQNRQNQNNRKSRKASSRQIKGLLLLLLTAMIWGFAFIAQKFGAADCGDFTFNAVRFILGAVSLIPVILLFERHGFDKSSLRATAMPAILSGVILATAAMLQQYGIRYTASVGTSGFLTGLYNLFTPIIGFLFLRKKTGLPVWGGALLALGGLYFLCTPENAGDVSAASYRLGVVLLIVGAVFWTLQILLIDHVVNRIQPLKFAMLQFLTCGLLCTIGALIVEPGHLTNAAMLGDALIPILYCGLMSVGVAYTCQIFGQRGTDPTFAAIVLSSESVFSAVGGTILGDERMRPLGYLGCGLIFAGIVVAQLKFDHRKKTTVIAEK